MVSTDGLYAWPQLFSSRFFDHIFLICHQFYCQYLLQALNFDFFPDSVGEIRFRTLLKDIVSPCRDALLVEKRKGKALSPGQGRTMKGWAICIKHLRPGSSINRTKCPSASVEFRIIFPLGSWNSRFSRCFIFRPWPGLEHSVHSMCYR